MAQYLRPSSDVATGTWTSTPLYEAVNETPYSDTDYISGPSRASSTCQLGMSSVTDPVSSSGHVLRVRAYLSNTGLTLTFALYCGATLIKSWDPGVTTGSFAPYEYTLSSSEADAITDYADLRFHCIQTYSSGTGTRRAYVSWVEMEVPNAPAQSASTSKATYMKGGISVTTSKSSYVKGCCVAVSISKPAFIKGSLVTNSSKSAYLRGGYGITSNKFSFIKGKDTGLSNKSAFIRGGFSSLGNKSAYIKGKATTLSNKSAFIQGKISTVSNKPAYITGVSTKVTNKSAYISGTAGGGAVQNSHNAFVLGLGSNSLVPNADILSSGVWKNQDNSISNLYQSIDEFPTPSDSDYVWNTVPTNGYYYECALSDPTGIVGSGEILLIWRGCDKSGLGSTKANVEFREGSTIIASGLFTLTSIPKDYYISVTPAQRASISDWTNLRVRTTIVIV